MKWFKRCDEQTMKTPTDSRTAVQQYRHASEEAAERSKEASDHLANLLKENGFTLKLFVAAGGKTKKR